MGSAGKSPPQIAMKKVFLKPGWLYHPVTIFFLIQVLWILVMVVWIRWYLEKHEQIRTMAERLRTQAEVEGPGWLPLLEGGLLLTLILAGATVIFIYYVKQHRLNQMQRAFVSNITHELKSPVASIQLALETMALRDLSDDRKREFVAMMLDDTERLSTLIDRILGAARIEKRRGRYRLEPVSMRHFVEEILAGDRHLYEKDGRVIIFEKGRDARVAIDRTAMRVVLANLLENAARYSPAGSKIKIRLHRDLRSCRLDVIDSGDGIRGKDLKNVFKMFWRGSEEKASRVRGTGLGLYIVRNIVKDHRGKVWASSQGIGRGSTFSVRLPRARKYWSLAARRNLSSRAAVHK
ncbi:MAG: histidine kinase [Acidobacteria bacterium]|nr:histidine kinase [Acidobacteriota bacterium]